MGKYVWGAERGLVWGRSFGGRILGGADPDCLDRISRLMSVPHSGKKVGDSGSGVSVWGKEYR